MSTRPQVGDPCKANPVDDNPDNMVYGKITKIDYESGLAYSDMEWDAGMEFCGDIPTRTEDFVWVFDSF